MTRIPIEDLVVGGIYVMRARHFSVGIWTGKEFRGVHLQHGRWVIVGEDDETLALVQFVKTGKDGRML